MDGEYTTTQQDQYQDYKNPINKFSSDHWTSGMDKGQGGKLHYRCQIYGKNSCQCSISVDNRYSEKSAVLLKH